jgi:hypothetical protein
MLLQKAEKTSSEAARVQPIDLSSRALFVASKLRQSGAILREFRLAANDERICMYRSPFTGKSVRTALLDTTIFPVVTAATVTMRNAVPGLSYGLRVADENRTPRPNSVGQHDPSPRRIRAIDKMWPPHFSARRASNVFRPQGGML